MSTPVTPDLSMAHHYTPDPEIGLFGGRWVPNGRGTVKWVQERTPAPMPDEPRLPLCRRCKKAFDRPRHLYCSDDCFKAARREQRRTHDRARGSRKGPCQDCGAPRDWQAKRCKACSIQTREIDGKWAA